MSSFVLIRHKVRDFNAWKTGFDAHSPKRAAAGLSTKELLHSTDDANEVFIVLGARDVESAKAFIASPDLRDTMQSFSRRSAACPVYRKRSSVAGTTGILSHKAFCAPSSIHAPQF